MDRWETIKSIYKDFDKAVMLTDEQLIPVWDNGKGVPKGFSAEHLTVFGGRKPALPVTKPVVAQYTPPSGKVFAVQLQPIKNGEKTKGCIITFYGCEDIEMLEANSGHLLFRSNFLGNIRNELSQIICALDLNKQKYVDMGDIDYLYLDSLTRQRILRAFSATTNLGELSRYYNGLIRNYPLSASQVISELCERADEQFEKTETKFTYDIQDKVFITSNAERLGAAVGNLLINAYIYCNSEHKECSLTLRTDNSNAIIEISDNGDACSEKKLMSYRKPFEAFEDFGDHESLGISVAAMYCRSLGGELVFKAGKNKPTTAIMTIPLPEKAIMQHELKAVEELFIPVPYGIVSCIFAKGFDRGE